MSAGRPWSQEDIDTVRRMAADGATARQIGAALGRTRDVVHGLRRRFPDITFTHIGRDPLAAPEDFAEQWPLYTGRQLARRYGRAHKTIIRWASDLGLSRPASWRSPEYASKKPKPQPRVRKTPVEKPKVVSSWGSAAPVDRPHRDMSPAGQAADYLRGFGVVYRCTPTGRADEKGTHWRRGSAVLTDAELIERAAWMRSRRAAA